MTYLDNFLKSYPGTEDKYIYTTVVNHRGTIIAFAMNAQRRIFYTVLALEQGGGEKSPVDVNYWADSPSELHFSNEIAQVGASVAGQTRMPIVKRGGRTEGDPRGVRLDEIDPFLSTTARLTAKAPFCVLSDDQHVYIFRQSIAQANADMVFKLVNGASSGNANNPALVKDSSGANVPLVDSTLLMDRFVLAGTRLAPKLEVRYRRSRHKERPQGQKDTPGAKDMDGVPFFEPTQELDFVSGLSMGRFSVLLLPTQVADVQRWQIFTYNQDNDTVDTFNVEKSRDGFFNTHGTQFSSDGIASSGNDTPGIRRDYLKLQNCGALTGIAAQLYYQQEELNDNAGKGADKPVKQNARVLVALSTAAISQDEKPYIAALDFAVTRSGGLNSVAATKDSPYVLDMQRIDRQSAVQQRDDSTRQRAAQQVTNLQAQLNRLTADITRYSRAKGHLESLKSATNGRINSGARFHLDRDYKGKKITLKLGGESYIGNLDARTDDGQSDNWKDEISSVSVDYGVTATLWEHRERNGDKVQMTGSDNLPSLNDDTLSIEIREDGRLGQDIDRAVSALSADADLLSSQFNARGWKSEKGQDLTVATQELALIRSKLSSLEREQATAQTALRQAQSQVDQLGTINLGEAQMPMPLLHTDESGLALTGGILAFAWSEQPPMLLDSGIGQVALYFRGDSGQFFAAYYDTICGRGRFAGELDGSLDRLALTLRSSELDASAVTIEIRDDGVPDLCRVSISQAAGHQESWNAVPRDVHEFVQVLNGQKTEPIFAGHGVLLDAQTLLLSPSLYQSFSATAPVPVQVGTEKTAFTNTVGATAEGDLHCSIRPLSNLASGAEAVGTLASVSSAHSVMHLQQRTSHVIPAGSVLQIDEMQVTVRARTLAGATQIKIHAVHERVLQGLTGKAIDILPYDGLSNRTISTLSHSSGPQSDTAFLQIDAVQANPASDKAPRVPELKAGDVLRVGAALLRVEEQLASGQARVVRMNRATTPTSGTVERLREYPIFRLAYDYERNTQLNKIMRRGDTLREAYIGPLHHGSILATAKILAAVASVDEGDEATSITVKNGTLTLITPDAHPPRWVGNAPGQALALTGSGGAKLADLNQINQLDAEGDLSLEMWVKSSRVGDEAQLNEQALLYHHNETSRYALGLTRVVEQRAFEFGGAYYVKVPSMMLNFTQGLTLECWVHGYYGGAFFDFGNENTNEQIIWGFDASMATVRLKVVDASGTQVINEATPQPIKQNTWSHVAVTVQPTASGSTIILYKDGELAHQASNSYAFNTAMTFVVNLLGATQSNGSTSPRLFGKMDELRVWTYARSKEQIHDGRFTRVTANTDGLAACWRFAAGQLAYGQSPLVNTSHSGYLVGAVDDYSGNGYNGIPIQVAFTNDPPTTSPISLADSPFQAYSISSGVGQSVEGSMVDVWAQSETACIQPEQWHHIAATYNQSYALRLADQSSFLSVDHAAVLNLNQDLTIEAFVQVDALGTTQGIIAKGALRAKEQVPYALTITEEGKLRLAFENQEGQLQEFTSTSAIQSGKFHKIAVTRKRGYETAEHKKQMSSDEKKKLGLDEGKSMELVEGVDVQYWHQIAFYIDGAAAGSARYSSDDIATNSQSVTVGRVRNGLASHHLAGILSEVRIWSEPVAASKVGKHINGSEQGLAAWWLLNDSEGSVAIDSKGGNSAKLNGTIQWINSPDATQTGSTWRLYRDGVLIPSRSISTTPLQWGYEDAFALGAGDANDNAFLGDMEEVRIWRTPRTQEQILDNLFTRLKGEAADLIAYYTFDPDYADSERIVDAGLRGIDLTVGTTSINISTAPISVDTADVRSAISLVKTRFHSTIDAPPAAAEYGDLQYDFDGNAFGVLKRCYAFIRNGAWHLVTGYKVGNLITEWIGQAQFDPQIMGYVEGAPPVPSENLTFGPLDPSRGDYADSAAVTIREADEVTYTFARSEEKGMDVAFEGDVGFGMAGGTHLVMAPLGIGVLQNMAQWKLANSLSAKFNASQSWSSEEKVSIGRNRTRDLTVGLSGAWESTDRLLNDAVGRRYQPVNMGFALVQSETADIYALRMEHNRMLVAFRFLPNPDIPADVNLVPFPINPRYTKQGTLDGGIGYGKQGKILDPDYPQATTYGEHSYFKPREAYAIKKRIQQEEHRLRSYYESYEAISGGAGAGIAAGVGAAGAAMSGSGGLVGVGMGVAALASGMTMLGQAMSEDKSAAEKIAKRNLTNTYVWTADGGFYAEETELTDVKQETVGGSYSFSGGIGGSTKFEIDALGGSLSFGMTGTLGGHYSLTKTKSEEAKRAFSVDVKVNVPGDLQEYDSQRKRIYDAGGNPISVPGKVDAYRFMTFYLASDHNNFDDLFGRVVDPIWLQQSTHPNAAAMRQAQQVDKKPPCWRVFHRVTFVSRILPDFPVDTAPPLPKAMKSINVDSNWELIQRLEPYVNAHTGDPTAFRRAVHDAVQTHIPELSPHLAEIQALARDYFGVVGG